MDGKILTLPLRKKIIYALGGLGWSLASFTVLNSLVYFYLPPQTGELTFPAFFDQGMIFAGMTWIGITLAVGRLFDAITDPLIAGLSDRSTSGFGRRRKYLAISALPFSILSFLVFFPPSPEKSMTNVLWMFSTVIIFYWFMTMYVTPFYAWISELGHNQKERLLMSTLLSVAWAVGYAVGSQIYLFQSLFEKSGFQPLRSFQMVAVIFAIAGFLLMLLPVIFIDEKKYCEQHYSKEGIFEAVVSAFKNREFLKFTFSDLTYWVAITGISTGLVYYVTTLLRQPKETASLLQLIMFALSFLFYLPVNFIAGKLGKKKVLLFGFFMYSITFAYVFFLGKIAFIDVNVQGYLLTLLASIPLSIFGILPNAVIADIAEADGKLSGNFKAAIFFGARTFMSKIGQMIAGIVFPSLLILGMEPGGNDWGVRLTAAVSLVFVLAGGILLIKYDEKKINSLL